MNHVEPDQAMLASDADRDRAVDVLHEAAVAGRITLDELQERIDRALGARTYADLAPLTADLPKNEVSTDSRPPAPRKRTDRGTLRLKRTGRSIVQHGGWEAPQRVMIVNPAGTSVVDFRAATLLSPTVEVFLSAVRGDVELTLPPGATARITADSSLDGSIESRVPSEPAPPAPHFRIVGDIRGGSLTVR